MSDVRVKTCTSCKFFKRAWFLSVRGDICTNDACDEQGWTYRDTVTGETTEYPRRHKECSLARYNPCGHQAIHWQPRNT